LTAALALLAVAVGASTLVLATLRSARARLPVDAPNARTMHAGEVPRGGGLAIWAGFAPVALIAPPDVPGPWALWLASLALVTGISLADDLRNLPAAIRLLSHLVAAAGVAMAIGAGAGPLAIAALALAIAWGANLYNFMDGSDGLAASMAITGFGAYAAGAWHADAGFVAFAALALATVPFWIVNRPPASMFMGDVGAVPLGFLAAACGAAGTAQGWWPAWFPLLVFLPFWGDATVTLARRALRGEAVWEPHRSHYYQRLNALGAGHRGTFAILAASMLACAALGLACLVLTPQAGWAALGVAVAAHACGFAAIDYHWGKRR
jgi:UDP-GlcNAc:undecaprenyl-phosphate/decaprenyl-phosphate GlcNAc-1-phosphate transferase